MMTSEEKYALEVHRQEQARIEKLEIAEEEDRRIAEREKARWAARAAELEAERQAHLSAEEQRYAANRAALPDVSSVASFKALPLGERSKYYSAFGADFLSELRAREKAGLSQAEWDKLRAAKPVLSAEEQELRTRVGPDGRRGTL